ncbi:MAG: dihydrofolate reductase [Gammaproteobacteria bacterium]
MSVSIVVAMTPRRVIGRRGALPWHLPDDLRRFRRITMGHAIVMGRRTFESIGHALPGRTNIVVTATQGFKAPGCAVVDSFVNAMSAAAGDPEIMVIGGQSLYRAALAFATRIYLTEIAAKVDGDVFFPLYDRALWQETAREYHPRDDVHAYPFSFIVLEREVPPAPSEP